MVWCESSSIRETCLINQRNHCRGRGFEFWTELARNASINELRVFSSWLSCCSGSSWSGFIKWYAEDLNRSFVGISFHTLPSSSASYRCFRLDDWALSAPMTLPPFEELYKAASWVCSSVHRWQTNGFSSFSPRHFACLPCPPQNLQR